MRVSVFTPSHAPAYLDECHRSLCAQTLPDWEWVVLLNGGATWSPTEPDSRVRVLRGGSSGLVGAAKREACAAAGGDILVELDHDDLLAPACLAEIVAAYEAHPDAALVYSDFAQMNADGTPNLDTFNVRMGWEYAAAPIGEQVFNGCRALEASPHNVSYIWYAPNHVRAFRRTAYDAIGGYDGDLEVLDDQDLMMRLYQVGDFHRIPRCLYLQRLHPANTQRDQRINPFIQADTVARYWRGIAAVATSWAARRGLAALDLRTPGAPPRTLTGGCLDLELDPDEPRLPYEDGSVGVIAATELLQRIRDRGAFFAECYRVLTHGGLLLTTTPSTDGRGAFQDPTHVTYWNENSFWYVTQATLREHAYPGHDFHFQVSGIRTWFPTPWDETNHISYVGANLLCVKDGPRQGGPLLC